ncbi:hypothetical protein, variant [Sphaeroforma arctica JP610]|uniref:Double-strand break repair protein n=1 Tax=Sphaeroforma arctica JP610 TaxID=667725 RepID=A0A0L0GCT4_9EUKA|nr:hypothetical protein, variant [Sphaeroforma arctica JP610]KNC86827.1 hypothetical protein, variant [Sphaeroforma arctica JP610]|eukprot:XP_014160729.1 hypothetical protein, variant [Sphaeroforma arctica JP610]
MVAEVAPENRIRILVATDNHVGYRHEDKVRGNDALTTFEEILQIAVRKEVDLVLLGGDLFHDNDPPRAVQFAVANLLKRYCFGSKPIQIKTLATGEESDRKPFNYMDPNINISLPVFSIHGNHDDPVGKGNLAALDLLEVADTINYFGKQKSFDEFSISPILLQKGCTRIALYGLGNIKDDRLYRTFEARKVKFNTEVEGGESTFNLFVLHQNRVRHGAKNYLPENVIPTFMDLAIWGHEHESYTEAILGGQDQSTYIYQPGSSIITSLCAAETKPKHVGLLSVMRRPNEEGPVFDLEPIPLMTVRPLVIGELDLAQFEKDEGENVLDMKDTTRVEKLLTSEVKKLIAENTQKVTEEAMNLGTEVHLVKTMPLIRLKVKYNNYTPLNIPRFGQKFVDQVANPRDILSFTRVKKDSKSTKKMQIDDDEDDDPETAESERAKKEVIDLFVESMKKNIGWEGNETSENDRRAIRPAIMSEAVREYVDKQSKDSINNTVEYCRDQYAKYRRTVKRNENDDENFAPRTSNTISSDDEPPAPKAPRGRGRGGGIRARASRKRGRSFSFSPEAPPAKPKFESGYIGWSIGSLRPVQVRLAWLSNTHCLCITYPIPHP